MEPDDLTAGHVRALDDGTIVGVRFHVSVDRDALEARARDGVADGGVPVCISSELPVRRRDWRTGDLYDEILSHAPGDVDLSAVPMGLPLIFGHNTWSPEQPAIVRDLRVDSDKKLRGVAYFSRSTAGQEVRQDMVDAVRPYLSVGYELRDYSEETQESGIMRRVYRKWRPREVSIVPVPADTTVGPNRAAATAATPERTNASVGTVAPIAHSTRNRMDPDDIPTGGAPAAVNDTRDRERNARAAHIMQLAEAAGLTAGDARALIDSDRTPADIGRQLLADAARRGAPQPAPNDLPLTPKEQRQYSVARAMNALVEGRFHNAASFERELSDEIAKRTGRAARNDLAFFMPYSLEAESRGLVTSSPTAGGNTVQTTVGPLVELLQLRSRLLNPIADGGLGATFMSGLSDNFSWPRETGVTDAVWGTEAPASDIAESNATFGTIPFAPKDLAANTKYSRKMLAQSTIGVENYVRGSIVRAHARAIDRAGIAGATGGNNPVGVLFTTGTNLVAMGTNGAQLTLPKALEAFREIETDNADLENARWALTPGVKWNAAATARIASTDSVTLYDARNNVLEGMPVVTTNALPTNLVKGSSGAVCHGAIFGDFSQVVVGVWGPGAEIVVDPYTLAARNLVRVISYQMVDVAVLQPTAFAVFRDLLVP